MAVSQLAVERAISVVFGIDGFQNKLSLSLCMASISSVQGLFVT